MSLVIVRHERECAIVLCDSRVSKRLPNGHCSAVAEETVKKFVVLRARPGLVLAGTSSFGKWLDFAVFEGIRRCVEDFPDASFDQVARMIGPVVFEARAAFGISGSGASCATAPLPWARKFLRARRAARNSRGMPDGNFLSLVGFDRGQMRVRNRTFACTDSCSEQESSSGITISGFPSSEEAWALAGKFLDLLGRDHSPKATLDAMLAVASEISATYPEAIGPPYFLHIVTKGESRGGAIIEEQFRCAIATWQRRVGELRSE